MYKNYDKTIKDMYSKINTPNYDPTQDVLSRIRSASPSKVVLKRILIISIIFCLSLIALGAAELVGWQTFNIFGEKTGEGSPILPAITIPPGYENENYTPIKRITPEPEDPEIVEYYMNFMEETLEDEVRVCIRNENGGGGGCSNSGFSTKDFPRIQYVLDANKTPLKVPSYIPEGYKFFKGSIDFYVDYANQPEVIYEKNEDNRTYWIYKLQKGYEEKVLSISLIFKNQNGDELSYAVQLLVCSADSYEHYASESASVESISVSGFDEGIWIQDKARDIFPNQLILFKEISPINAIDLYNLSFRQMLASNEDLPEDFMMEDIQYISTFYRLDASSLDEDELIKIAESIN